MQNRPPMFRQEMALWLIAMLVLAILIAVYVIVENRFFAPRYPPSSPVVPIPRQHPNEPAPPTPSTLP